jgi:hypothetical protein
MTKFILDDLLDLSVRLNKAVGANMYCAACGKHIEVGKQKIDLYFRGSRHPYHSRLRMHAKCAITLRRLINEIIESNHENFTIEEL